MALLKIFKSHIPSISYITRIGGTCVFIEGKYMTDSPEEVAELTEQITKGKTPHLWIDPKEFEIDTTIRDEIAEAQAQAARDVLAKHAALASGTPQGEEANKQTQAPGATQGMSPAQLLNIGGTNLAQMAAASNSK